MKNDKFENAITDQEINVIIPIIKSALIGRYNKGLRDEYSSTKMVAALRTHKGVNIRPARLRKLIHYIVINGMGVNLVLCANNKGYYLTNDPTTIRDYLNSLESRISSQLARYKAIGSDLARLENKQQLKITDIFFPKSLEP